MRFKGLFQVGLGSVAAMWLLSGGASAFETPAKQAYLIDMATGAVLLDKAGDERMYPASMTKIMTMYLLFKEMKEGRLTLDSTLPVSEKAWRMGGSKMFVDLNSQVRIEDLIRGILIQSGNDACIVVAEGLAGTEEEFARRMTAQAVKLGMNNTQFLNSTGWPDEGHYTTAHDLVILSNAVIRDFPEYYHYFSELEFTWHGIRQQNRNMLLSKDMNVDGLKTGHTEVSGYGEVVSAVDKNNAKRRLIAVVHGLSSTKERAEVSEAVLRYGLFSFETKDLYKANAAVTKIPVAMGEVPEVEAVVLKDVPVTMPVAEKDKTTISAEYDSPLIAPIAKDTVVGTLRIKAAGMKDVEVPLVVTQDIKEAGFVQKFMLKLKHLLGLGA